MPTYTTLLIPVSLSGEHLNLIAQKLRTFKLHALLSDPNAFSQSHAAESLLPFSVWEARVANPDFRIMVCIVDDRGDRDDLSREDEQDEGPNTCQEGSKSAIVERLVVADWVGTFTLVGPVARETWLYPLSEQPVPAPDGAETRWHLTSLFVLPEHRGRGLAAKLTLAAVQAGSSIPAPLNATEDQGADRKAEALARFRLIVHPNNKAVVGLYEKLGFIAAGMYTQREAMMAMGDAAGIPSVAEAEKWDVRTGIGMECLVKG